ncbi:hypothetical protein ZYGR_0P03500 [Zygosaccharomyces rouxii]|uniref:ZYRO0E08580p n=2 Tax=Zygosaccharomyces rouxii TaxID=4956 RepID=C5E4T3_ZYGRC|nr:uncharacterized protein ZYRO0E08580g [Zygosaccharomyces rouxii]KAH9198100.1 Phox homologous domain-containing protein [Zygosaccharomyces rouxii]GAV49704.1 hypothetical protein ZYGR_0P03500 [Zygosaccharomyces rouxii]CAR31044.1 ZYRO0E08580p [Zygosaccharomyces rouxii]
MRPQRIEVAVVIDDIRIVKESYALYGVLVKVIRSNDESANEQSYEHRVYRRFSEFWDLKMKLEKEFGTELPYELPQRQFGLWKQSSLDPDVIEERKITLANFLQDLLNDSFDTKWKNSPQVCKFLKLSSNWNSYEPKNSDLPSSQGNINDPTQWLTTFRDSKHLLESCKRGMASSVTRDLMQLRLVLHDLENALKRGSEKLGQAEFARRQNLLQTLKKDMNEFALESSSRPHDSSNSNNNNEHNDLKVALFEGPTEPRTPKKPAIGRRRFGETEETAPLNNQQLLQLHKDSMSKQDLEMKEMHKIVQRQKDLSLAMNQELLQDNELLDSLNDGVDNTASKLRTANRRAKQFNNE